MSELSPPPIRAAIGQGRTGPVFLTDPPWQLWFAGVYERIGRLDTSPLQDVEAQLAVLQAQVAAMDTEVTALQTAVSGLQQSVSLLQQQFASLSSAVINLQLDFLALANELEAVRSIAEGAL